MSPQGCRKKYGKSTLQFDIPPREKTNWKGLIRSLQVLLIPILLALVTLSDRALAEEVDPDYIIDRPDYITGEPWYRTAKSTWSVGLRTGLDDFPSSSAQGDLFQITGDWIIPWQTLGLFSVGPQFAVLNLKSPVVGTVSDPLNLMLGATFRYQLKLMKNQPLVPTVALSWDYYRLKSAFPVAPYATGSGISFSAGLLLNLGWIDRDTAKEAFQSLGMTRAYLTAEVQSTAFQNTVFSRDAVFYLFGIRFEFE